jgi:hypothetical protein
MEGVRRVLRRTIGSGVVSSTELFTSEARAGNSLKLSCQVMRVRWPASKSSSRPSARMSAKRRPGSSCMARSTIAAMRRESCGFCCAMGV